MREILFRGKTDKGEWVEGYYVHYDDIKDNGKDDCDYIVQKHNGVQFPFVQVIPETVGQYTGLTDKNGNKIFDGDIVKVCRGVDIDTGYVLYDERAGAYVVQINDNECLAFIDYFIAKQTDDRVWIEKNGNIHDNPELLKGGAE